MRKFSDKKVHRLLIACTVICVLFLLLVVSNFIRSAGGSLGDAEYNLEMVREHLVDFEKKTYSVGNKDLLPENPRFLVVRQDRKTGEWSLIYQSDKSLNRKQWTEEDLERFDLVVMATSTMKSERYTSNKSTDIVTISAEQVKLTYYDTARRVVYAGGNINRSLPDKTDTSTDRTVGNKEITDKVREKLGLYYVPTVVHVITIAITLVSGVFAFLLLKEKKDRRKKAAAAAETAEPAP